jgi:hypothetical protein
VGNDNPQVPSSGTKLPSVNVIKKSSTNNLLDNSRSSYKDSRYGKDSRMMNLNTQSKDQILLSTPVLDKKYESTVNHLKNIIIKEKRKVKDLKSLYMR